MRKQEKILQEKIDKGEFKPASQTSVEIKIEKISWEQFQEFNRKSREEVEKR